ncbi:MAG: hypothetical protein M0C28_41265 [Candidatus Moduliflexus flocculans]|nr:hypothetical protein [Candidatus Moduliflexus flocculans]
MKKITIVYLIAGLLLSACNRNPRFISDSGYRKLVTEQFEKQKELASSRSEHVVPAHHGGRPHPFRKGSHDVPLCFHAPQPDLADYDGGFYLKNVRASFAAKECIRLGKTVPEELFQRRFAHPREQHENLDTSGWSLFHGTGPCSGT